MAGELERGVDRVERGVLEGDGGELWALSETSVGRRMAFGPCHVARSGADKAMAGQ